MSSHKNLELGIFQAIFTPSGIECVKCASIARSQVLRIWALCLFFLLCSAVLNQVPPNLQFAIISDPRYHYPLLKETFPSYVCVLIAFGIPAVIFLLPHLLSVCPRFRESLQVESTEPTVAHFSNDSLEDREENLSMLSRSSSTSFSNRSTQCSVHVAFSSPKDSRWYRGLLANSSTFLGLIMTISASVFITTLLKTIAGRPRPNAVTLSLQRHLKAKEPQFVPDPLFVPSAEKGDVAPLLHIATALASVTSAAYPSIAAVLPPSSPLLLRAGSVLAGVPIPSSSEDIANSLAIFMSNNVQYAKESSYAQYLVNESLRSFPSGHSSFTFACMIYLILVLVDKYHALYDNSHPHQYQHIPTTIQDYAANGPIHPTPRGPVMPRGKTTKTSSPSWTSYAIRIFRPLFFCPETVGYLNYTSTCGSPSCARAVHSFDSETEQRNITQGTNTNTNPMYASPDSKSDDILSSVDNSARARVEEKKVSLENDEQSDSALIYENTTSTNYPPHFTQPSRATAYTCYMLIPLLVASTIAISRIWDYWHHADDVLAGSLLGMGCAFAVRKMLR